MTGGADGRIPASAVVGVPHKRCYSGELTINGGPIITTQDHANDWRGETRTNRHIALLKLSVQLPRRGHLLYRSHCLQDRPTVDQSMMSISDIMWHHALTSSCDAAKFCHLWRHDDINWKCHYLTSLFAWRRPSVFFLLVDGRERTSKIKQVCNLQLSCNKSLT